MFKFGTARKIFSIIFLLTMFGASMANFIIQEPTFRYQLSGLRVPTSQALARDDISQIEKAISGNIAGKPYFVNAYGYLHLLMGKNEMSDFAQLRAEDGSLHYGNPFPVDTGKMRNYAARLHRLKLAAEAGGAKMIFLNPPDKIIKGKTLFAPGMPYQDFNVTQDAFLYYLGEYGVDYLDTRQSLLDNDLPLDKFAYQTDHHWTVEASFEAFTDLVAELNRRYFANLDPEGFYQDKNNYEFKTYQNLFLGSLGRSTGSVYSGLEDFTTIQPKFDSDYSVEIVNLSNRFVKRQGPAEKSTLYPDALKGEDHYPYNFYLMGIAPWVKITNLRNPHGPRLLLVHDSYSTPLASFLAPLFSEIHMIWPLTENAIKVDQYMAEFKFDYVVVELYSGNISDEGVNFFRETGE